MVTALALSTGGGPRGSEPGPAEESTATSTPTEPNPATSRAVPVYFVGDTPSGPRLYREFQRGTGPMSAETFALDAALGGASLDPDYRSLWPADAVTGAYLMTDDLITRDPRGRPARPPAGMTEAEARLAIEQVVRTAQGVFGQRPDARPAAAQRLPHRPGPRRADLRAAGSRRPTSRCWPASPCPSRPRAARSAWGRHSTVDGVGISEDGRVSIRIEGREGAARSSTRTSTSSRPRGRLAPFTVDLYLDDLEPGDYDVVATVTNPDGTFDTDTRRITVVD